MFTYTSSNQVHTCTYAHTCTCTCIRDQIRRARASQANGKRLFQADWLSSVSCTCTYKLPWQHRFKYTRWAQPLYIMYMTYIIYMMYISCYSCNSTGFRGSCNDMGMRGDAWERGGRLCPFLEPICQCSLDKQQNEQTTAVNWNVDKVVGLAGISLFISNCSKFWILVTNAENR